MGDLARVVAAATPIIVMLVAANFVGPPDMPWLARQAVLTGLGLAGVALVELFLYRTPPAKLATRMGFLIPRSREVKAALLVSTPMWAFPPLAAVIAGDRFHVAPDWFRILLGVALLNGLAEEVIHRAFVFGHLRKSRPFFRAAAISATVFAAQHLYLVATLGPVAGLASVALALLLGFPLAFSFEQGGNSVVGPAILHTSSNASFLVLVDPGNLGLLPLHMLVVLGSIYGVFLFPCKRGGIDRRARP